MKKMPRFLSRLFSPAYMQDIDFVDLLNTLNDPVVRRIWIHEVYQELRNTNLAVDRGLLSGSPRINDLSSRRKAIRDILEMILKAKSRHVEEKDPNPRFESEIDLDRVTV